jgi:hypothetical protein
MGERETTADNSSVRAEPVEGRPFYLLRHPDSRSPSVTAIQVQLARRSGRLRLHYIVVGEIEALTLPGKSHPARRDELWRHTCFELFAQHSNREYCEFNFSPSGAWAAYRFDDYRTGMDLLETSPPVITMRKRPRELVVAVELPDPIAAPVHLNLAAVIEEKSGTKSYWALAHPPEGPPDFHHPACFVLELPPA